MRVSNVGYVLLPPLADIHFDAGVVALLGKPTVNPPSQYPLMTQSGHPVEQPGSL